MPPRRPPPVIATLIAVAVASACAMLARASEQTPSAEKPIVEIRLNQVGYVPGAVKRATIVTDAAQPVRWELRDGNGGIVGAGTAAAVGLDADSGDRVQIADFSSFSREGTGYTLHAGAATSHPFDISPAVYHRLKYDALAYFFQTRSGIAIEMPYAGGPQWVRPAGHIGVPPNKGDTRVRCAPDTDCSYALDVSGGWYDAGDQGKYVVNGGIAVWTLMNEYERTLYRASDVASRTAAGDFADGTMNIPERHNGAPDLLDEVRWELEFLMRMQVPEGQPHAGMAHHKVHDVKWTPLPTRPELDPEERQLRPVSTAATLNLAAAAAQCARLWKTVDQAFASKCLTAAERAWSAASSNAVMLASPSDSTGGGSYSDRNVADEQYWAASELYIATGKQAYKDVVTRSELFRTVPGGFTSMTWNSTAALGSISLAVVPNGLARSDIEQIRRNIVAAADGYLEAAGNQGYGVPIAGRYQWGSNSVVLNNALVLALAFDFTQERRYLDAVTQAMDYILGRNAADKSYVSGYGERPLTNPHHRFWAKQADPSLPGPPPGVLAGGPNSALQDPRARTLAGCAPQKCYLDHYEAYSLNEVCLNWNAPLAWVAAWLDERRR
jgi:endoglucanase